MAALWKYHQFETDRVTEAASFFFFPSLVKRAGEVWLRRRFDSHVLSNQCSVAGLYANCCPSLIFGFTFHSLFFFLFLCFAICHFSWQKHHTTLKTVPRPRIYRGDVRRYKTSPPSFSMRCKLIGLCWLLWRYCLWWLPLAVFIFLGRCLDSPCSTAWRVTVATMNCVWCVVSFPLIILSWF